MALLRDRFDDDELNKCLSYYDLGDILEVAPFTGGSRRSPKVVVTSSLGKFLFKRRAKGKDDLAKVAFTHQIQLELDRQGFPLPHLVGTRGDNSSMLVIPPQIYEMFEFVEGRVYDGSPEETYQAGRTLGIYHKLLESFRGDYRPPRGTYHDASAIEQSIRATVSSLPLENRPPAEEVTSTVGSLGRAYRQAADRVIDLGMEDWPKQVVHGDWHPGNMLFREKCVVAVIDYDAARVQERVIDLANGALQFSIIGGTDSPVNWPANVDPTRFARFMRGYDSVNVVAKREMQAIPHLMCEAMIAEAVLPIAATGSFGNIDGFPFLKMVEAKVDWICSHQQQLCGVLSG
jgi:homoserine kinase type II